MGIVGVAIGDAAITFMWIFFTSCLGAATDAVSTYLGVQGPPHSLFVTIGLLTVLVFVFSVLGEAMGGAAWNPTVLSANYALGSGKHSLLSMAVRFPAQAIGAVGGALAISEVMPLQYKRFLGGPSLKVDMHHGAIAEGILTFLITFSVLLVIVRGPKHGFLKSLLISLATLVFVIAGSTYTGPSMNPVNAYAWAFVNNVHNKWEHFYVYWLTPFLGSIVAAWVFRHTALPAAAPKQKKA